MFNNNTYIRHPTLTTGGEHTRVSQKVSFPNLFSENEKRYNINRTVVFGHHSFTFQRIHRIYSDIYRSSQTDFLYPDDRNLCPTRSVISQLQL